MNRLIGTLAFKSLFHFTSATFRDQTGPDRFLGRTRLISSFREAENARTEWTRGLMAYLAGFHCLQLLFTVHRRQAARTRIR